MISVDQEFLGNNLYTDCGNNPITYVDYTGNRLTVGGGGSQDSLYETLKVTDSEHHDYVKGTEKPKNQNQTSKKDKSSNSNKINNEKSIPKNQYERTVNNINSLEEEIRPMAIEFINKAEENGIHLIITEGRRTKERQAELYAQGRTKPGKIVTWTMNSDHLTGKAFDIVEWNGEINWDSDWEYLGKLGKECGLKWGGDWEKTPDYPHFYID